MHLIQSGRIRVGGPKGPPNGARMSPPLRHMPMFYRMPSPTAGLIRVTPRHLPPTAYRMNMGNRPRMLTPSPIQNQRYEYEIFSGIILNGEGATLSSPSSSLNIIGERTL